MNGITPLYLLLCLAALASLAAGDGDPKASSDLETLHFRMVVVADEVYTVAGCFEGSESGGGYTQALLDMDGDGEADRTIDLEQGRFGISEGRFGFSFEMTVGGLNLNFEVQGSRNDPFHGTVYLYYTLNTVDAYLFFINGTASLHPSAEEAAKGKVIHIGPPFRYEVRSSTRGDKALINVGLKDANGCTLRIASPRGPDGKRGETSNITLTFLSGGKEGSSLEAQYG